MKYNIKKKKNSTEITGAGFCDFTKELQEDEEQILDVDYEIPEDIKTHFEYKDGKIIKRETPLVVEKGKSLEERVANLEAEIKALKEVK